VGAAAGANALHGLSYSVSVGIGYQSREKRPLGQ
jgi:hypothetical protein